MPIILSYLEGRTNEEVAELLHWPVGTVKGRLSRARTLLRSRLMRRGLTLSAAFLLAALADGAVFAEVVPPELVRRTVLFVKRFKAAPASARSSSISRPFRSRIWLPRPHRGLDQHLAETSQILHVLADCPGFPVVHLHRRRHGSGLRGRRQCSPISARLSPVARRHRSTPANSPARES